MATATKQTTENQIADLMTKRDELHAELVRCPNSRLMTDWFRDRANEMAYLNRQLARLGVIPSAE